MLLRLARTLARCWLWLYTVALDRDTKQRRTDDSAAYYTDWEIDQRSQGHNSEAIGLLLLRDTASGARDDLLWRWEIGLGVRLPQRIRHLYSLFLEGNPLLVIVCISSIIGMRDVMNLMGGPQGYPGWVLMFTSVLYATYGAIIVRNIWLLLRFISCLARGIEDL